MEKELEALFIVTEKLRGLYCRSFPLDGRLVGDIGEALVKRDFNVELYPMNNECYDAFEVDTNKQIQIKASMKYNFSFPCKGCPDYYLAVHINENATLEIIYNGRGQLIKDFIIQKGRKPYNNTYYTLAIGVLKQLDKKVAAIDRIKQRQNI